MAIVCTPVFKKELCYFSYLFYQGLFFNLPDCLRGKEHLNDQHKEKICQHFKQRKMILNFSEHAHAAKYLTHKIAGKRS